MDRRTKATQNRDKAVRLNEAWGVGAAQVRYHEYGYWYATLARLPAALFDAYGYLLFATEDEYRTSPHIRIGKRLVLSGYEPGEMIARPRKEAHWETAASLPHGGSRWIQTGHR